MKHRTLKECEEVELKLFDGMIRLWVVKATKGDDVWSGSFAGIFPQYALEKAEQDIPLCFPEAAGAKFEIDYPKSRKVQREQFMRWRNKRCK